MTRRPIGRPRNMVVHNKVCELYLQNVPIPDIAKEIKRSSGEVYRILNLNPEVFSGAMPQERPAPERAPSETTKAIIEWAKTSSEPLSAAAKRYGLSRQRVEQILNDVPEVQEQWRANRREARFKKRMEKETEREQKLRHDCELCGMRFRGSRVNQRFCRDCAPYHDLYDYLTNPKRYERQRLLVVQNKVKKGAENPQNAQDVWSYSSALRHYWYWREHGHLPTPNRRYFYSESSKFVRDKMGPKRWAEVRQRFDEYYADETRRVP